MKKSAITFLLLMAGFISVFGQSPGKERGSHKIDPEIRRAVLQVLDEYMTTFNAKDLNAWERTYQFPHYRLASGKMSVLEKAGLRNS